MTERTPRFERPKRGVAWPPGAKALVVVTGEAAADWPDFIAKLDQAARWIGGRPADRVLKRWLTAAGITLPTRPPVNPAKAKAAEDARDARLERLARHRDEVSDALAARAVPKAVELLVRRLLEQDEVEARIDDARGKLTEALVMQRAAQDDDEEAKRSARREVVLARLLLALEKDDRIAWVDLMRIVTHGIARHLELEGLSQAGDDDDERNPLIVEIAIPRPDPSAAAAVVVPQSQLPERTL